MHLSQNPSRERQQEWQMNTKKKNSGKTEVN